MDLALRVIDGSRAEVSVPDGVVSTPPTSAFLVRVFGRSFELSAGIGAFGRDVAANAAGIDLTESFAFQGGTLRMGSDSSDGFNTRRVGVWEGGERSLYCYFVNEAYNEMLELFSQGTIDAHTDGLVFNVTENPDVSVERGPWTVLGLESIGVVAFQPLSSLSPSERPEGRGTPVAGGDLYVERQQNPSGEAEVYYYLFNETTGARISPWPGATEDESVAAISQLRIGSHA